MGDGTAVWAHTVVLHFLIRKSLATYHVVGGFFVSSQANINITLTNLQEKDATGTGEWHHSRHLHLIIIRGMLRCSACFFWINLTVNESFSVISFAVKRKCYSLQHKIFPKTFGGIENDSYISLKNQYPVFTVITLTVNRWPLFSFSSFHTPSGRFRTKNPLLSFLFQKKNLYLPRMSRGRVSDISFD